MARFFAVLAKEYDPYSIDHNLFAMNVAEPRSVPLVCTKMIADDGYGIATVNGKRISVGKCYKFDFSPLPIYLLPVGEVATEFDKTYTVKLQGYKTTDGKKFATKTFKIKTISKHTDDGGYVANEQVAKDVSDEGIILLKNDGALPLERGSKVKLLGEYYNYRITAIGASFIKPRWSLNVKEAIEQNKGLRISDSADTALFFISRSSGENKDNKPTKGDYYLTDAEKEGLQDAAKSHKNLILILNTGYPIEMGFIKMLDVSAIIWTGFCGQRGSESLIDILCGQINPSGKLADTWPLDYFDTPSSKNFINLKQDSPVYSDDGRKYGARVFYEERQFVGYRYFDSFDKETAYPFGHGLSYTLFSIQSSASFNSETLSVKTTVKNIGSVNGKSSVLVYVQSPVGRRQKPKRTLCGFDKTQLLEPSASEELQIGILAIDFAVYDDKTSSFILEKGEYSVFVGGSIETAVKTTSFVLGEEVVVSQTISVCAPSQAVGSIDEHGNVEEKSQITPAKECIEKHANFTQIKHKELPRYKGQTITLQDVKNDISKLDNFVSQFTVRELADFSVCNGSCWGRGKNGAAGKLASSKKYGVPTLYMSDGNCGININGVSTGFPASNLLAGTFNKDLAYRVGGVLADESKEFGIAINLGPGANLHRNILCGRHSEYFSEDPILSGILMAYQAKGLEDGGIAATYKHLLANGIEFERKSAHSIIDERTVRELYLRVFDKAFSIYKPACVMTSYNPVNGIYPCENSQLLNNLLREKWGFDGFVMTDWGSYDTADSIRSVLAGTSLLTPGSRKHFRLLVRAVKKGQVDKAVLQNNVKQMMKVFIKLDGIMKIEIDRSISTIPTDYSWQFGIGNDHAFQMHRTDVCAHAKLAHDELGIKYIRFHGIFDDDMLCYQRLSDYKPFKAVPYSSAINEVNFKQIALVYDNVLSCGMKPFVELSFVPSALASGKKTGIRYLNNITQPKSLERWSAFIKEFISFLLNRYGKDEVESWYFEVWNEPDLAIFFKGRQKDYFKLYAATARAVKSVDENLRVGGPSSSACLWLTGFTEYCDRNSVPYDFISTHHYPGDAFGNSFSMKDAFKVMSIAKKSAKTGVGLSDTMTELFFRPEKFKTWRKGVLAEMDDKAKKESGDKPLFVTEWNSMAVFASPIHDEKYSAAFVAKTCMDLKKQCASYMFWCLSDVYEEQFMLGKPFHGGFGIVNNDGIPKSNFWAFKLLSKLYPKRLSLPKMTNNDIEYAAFVDGDKTQILVYAQDFDCAKDETVEVEISVNCTAKSVTAERIDDLHCNPKAEWQKLGSPDLLTREQAKEIKQNTQLIEETLSFTAAADNTNLKLTLSTNDTMLLTIE